MTVVPNFYEDEDPESVGSISLMLHEAIGKLTNFAPITYYQIEQVPLPNGGEAYTIDIGFQQREPFHAFLEVNQKDRPTYNEILELLMEMGERERMMKGVFDVCDN
jgi:hypothetical protein